MTDIGNILFLGAGKMATALAGGLAHNGYPVAQVAAYDVSADACGRFTANTGIQASTEALQEAVENADVVLLALKPQYLSSAVKPVQNELADKLVISIAAGITIASLEEYTTAQRVVRVMPNTPAQIGQGASAYAVSSATTDADRQAAEFILRSVGYYCAVPENLLDAVTGVSGSGPAFVFEFIQALSDGGVKCGLPRAEATKLAAQTVVGAAMMVLETGEHPMVLRDQVTSPGGTTIAGLAALDRAAFRSGVSGAVEAAANRSIELGKK